MRMAERARVGKAQRARVVIHSGSVSSSDMPASHSMVPLDSFDVFLTHKTMETTRPRPTFHLLSNALMPTVESAWARCALPTLPPD